MDFFNDSYKKANRTWAMNRELVVLGKAIEIEQAQSLFIDVSRI
jgi:hypothetical protein